MFAWDRELDTNREITIHIQIVKYKKNKYQYKSSWSYYEIWSNKKNYNKLCSLNIFWSYIGNLSSSQNMNYHHTDDNAITSVVLDSLLF